MYGPDERHQQHGPAFGDREVVHPRRRGGRIAGGQGAGLLGIQLISHSDQERALLDLDVLIAGVVVRREPVSVRHAHLDGGLARRGGIAADDGEERTWRKQGWYDPLQPRRVGRGLGHGARSQREPEGGGDEDGQRVGAKPDHGFCLSSGSRRSRMRAHWFLTLRGYGQPRHHHAARVAGLRVRRTLLTTTTHSEADEGRDEPRIGAVRCPESTAQPGGAAQQDEHDGCDSRREERVRDQPGPPEPERPGHDQHRARERRQHDERPREVVQPGCERGDCRSRRSSTRGRRPPR